LSPTTLLVHLLPLLFFPALAIDVEGTLFYFVAGILAVSVSISAAWW
jgi:hypothetical protein